MKKLYYFFILLHLPLIINAQNVGVGTGSPQQALDVNGGIKIGTATSNIQGTIRYNAGKFEGADGSVWKTFDNIPSGTIVLSTIYPNTTLVNAGFSFVNTLKANINTPFTQSAGANSWWPVSAGISGRLGAQSIWTGTKNIIWGGYNSNSILVNDGAIYDPTNDNWVTMSTIGAPLPRDQEVVIWTGTEMIVWGGYIYNSGYTYFNDGAKYDPATNIWTPMNTAGALTGRAGCAFAWTGTYLAVWGGNNGSGALTDGARYNPATDTWTTMNTAVNPGQRFGFGQAYNATDLYIWGGFFGPLVVNGYKYNFASDTWSILPVTGTPPAGKNGPIVKWTGSKLVVWGGSSADQSTHFNTGSVYNPGTSSWSAMTNSTVVGGGFLGAMFNNKLYLWGVSGGQYYDVALNSWNNYPSATFVRTDRNSPVVCETNFGFLSWGGQQYGALGSYLPFYEDGERFFANAVASITVNNQGVQLFYLYSKN